MTGPRNRIRLRRELEVFAKEVPAAISPCDSCEVDREYAIDLCATCQARPWVLDLSEIGRKKREQGDH